MLKARQKITRKELKEDPLVTYTTKAQQYAEEYAKEIIYGIIGIAAIITLSYLFYTSKKSAEASALSQVSIAEIKYVNGLFEEVKPDLLNIIQDFEGTLGAGRAVFYLANSYYFTGDLTNAEHYFQIYLDDYADSDLLKISSMEGLGHIYEDQNQIDKALSQYQEAFESNTHRPEAPRLLINIGKCYEQKGDYTAAREAYTRVQDEYSQSPYVFEAKQQLALISIQ